MTDSMRDILANLDLEFNTSEDENGSRLNELMHINDLITKILDQKEDLSEAVYQRKLAEGIFTCLYFNKCKKSVRVSQKLLKSAISGHDKFKHVFTDVILRYSGAKSVTNITPASSKNAYRLLKLTVHLVSETRDLPLQYEKLFPTLLRQIQTESFFIKKNFKRLFSLIPSESKDKIFNEIKFDEKYIVALAYFIDFMNESVNYKKYESQLNKPEIWEKFVKKYLMSKERPSEWELKFLSSKLATLVVDEKEFQSTVFPLISKAMLRSPENTLVPLGCILLNSKFLITEHVEPLIKLLTPHLHSPNDEIREQALKTSASLSKTLSQNSLKMCLEGIIAVYNGSEGKITVTSQKITIIRTLKEIGKFALDIKPLFTFIVENCIKMLEVEVHEGTLIEIIECIKLWHSRLLTANLTKEYYTGFFNYIPKALNNLKGPVRGTFNDLVMDIITATENYDEIGPFLCNHLVKNVTPQNQNFNETFPLACGLMETCSYNISSEEFRALCQNLLNSINEKIIHSSNNSTVVHIGTLAYWMCSLHNMQNFEKNAHIFTLCLAHKDYKVRQKLKKQMCELMENLTNLMPAFTLVICNTLCKITENPKVKKDILKCIANFIRNKKIEGCEEYYKESLIHMLKVSHQCDERDLWMKIVYRARYSPDEILENFLSTKIKPIYTNIDDNNDPTMVKEIIETISLLSKHVAEDVLNTSYENLKDEEFLKVTNEDFFIFNAPEGQLFNTSVLDADDTSKAKNLKRESKVYSYKEQLEEIQLRKELEAKRKIEGKKKDLNPKQKEAQRIQLEKESKIRSYVQALNKELSNGFLLLGSLLEGNPLVISENINEIIAVVLPLLESPLGSPFVVDFFLKLGNKFFTFNPLIGESIGQLTFRILNAEYNLDKRWQALNVKEAITLLMNRIESISQNMLFTNINYSYCFPMMNRSLIMFPSESNILVAFLKTTAYQLRKRDETIEFLNPNLLPRNEICKLIYKIVGTNDGFAQHLAISVLLELARSWDEDSILTNELNQHLLAMKSHLNNSRDVALRSVIIMSKYFDYLEDDCIAEIKASLYREVFDPIPENAKLAKEFWELKKYEVTLDMLKALLNDVRHPCEEVRVSSSKALGNMIKKYPEYVDSTVEQLINIYNDQLIAIPPVIDHLGRVLQESIDLWEGRSGVGMALKEISPILSPDSAKKLLNWILNHSLPDRNQEVHVVMLEAGLEIISNHGKSCLNEFVEEIKRTIEISGQNDNVRQASVVLMGSVARYFEPNDARVKAIFETLLDTLSTPSERVQEAVANSIPALADLDIISCDAKEILLKLIDKVKTSEKYGERRGAAYGIAGMIKGLGILSLKEYDVMNILAEGMQDKKNYKHREGCLMALELLCSFLGKLFEPYIVHVLPHLLQCLGDSNQYVRETTENTSKSVMTHLSAHGVKLVLPCLLDGLNEDHWRTKSGSVELLGRMSYCAPRQLSACLPLIVPKLIEVLGDSHVKVQEAGAKALRLIGSVIKNPEIQSIVPILLEALQDPVKKSSPCLQILLKTEFIHMVDAPSLALIMPVVERAFQDRSTENRKLAAQIIGNMYSLTELSDLAPYLPKVMPGLKASLLDPVPEVRAVAAKALGAMSKGMGDKVYEELLPWLMKMLISEANSVDRSGAAQGLAEVLGALGVDKLHKFMPEVIKKADTDDIAPHMRDGYMMMFIYMPSVFEDDFVVYIGQIINPILKALADENEFVRETALKAGQRIVTGFSDSAITLLLPQLEKGIFNDNWRIRYSSIQLLGDLLFKISGVSGKMSTLSSSDDDNFGTEQNQEAIIKALGMERRNRVLASIYMGRSDVALMVRQASLHVWKVVVANTPKTLRELLPTLFSLLLGCLASSSHDKRQVAARTLGDLVRKLGEKILPEIIPILERGLESDNSEERQGVCIGLSEIMASTSKDMVLAFVDNLVPTLRRALCDPNSLVRHAAAQTFASLHSTVGTKALDEILPFMLKKLGDPEEGDFALDGLGQVLAVRSRAVMPYLVPQLTTPPVNTKALSIIASVAGESLSKHLGKILPALLSVMVDPNADAQDKEYCDSVIISVSDGAGVRLLVEELLDQKKNENLEKRKASLHLMYVFCAKTKTDLHEYVPQFLRSFILLLANPDVQIQKTASDTLGAIVKNLSGSEQMDLVSDLSQAIRFAQSELKGTNSTLLPGLCLPKGISPLLPIYREALLNGNADLKEQASEGLQELIKLSSADALKPSVIHITGPLIRILGDRYGSGVRTAVLDTLTILLSKVGIHLRAFMPQLQTTFLKASYDIHRNVRQKAALAMAQLVLVHNKPDSLFQELYNLIKQTEDPLIRETMIYSLRCVITQNGEKMTEPLRKNIAQLLTSTLSSGEDTNRVVSAGCFGALFKCMTPGEIETNFSLITSEDDNEGVRIGKYIALSVVLKEATACIYQNKKIDKIHKILNSNLQSDKPTFVSIGIRGCGFLFMYLIKEKLEIPKILLPSFAKVINNECNEVKTLFGQMSEVIGRKIYPEIIPKELGKVLLPSLVNGTKEKNSIVRASCESALVYILHLRDNDDSALKVCLNNLENQGAQDSLQEVVNKLLLALKKSINQPEAREVEVDDTILT